MDQSTSKGNIYLVIGGLFSLAFALFQVSAIFWTKELLIYFGGPVTMQAENPVMYIVLCVFVGTLVALCGLYALSGAGKFRRLPLLKTILVAITVIFILRGCAAFNDMRLIRLHPELNIMRFLVYSIIAFCVGIVHLLGVIRLFKHGRPEFITNE